MTQRGQLPPNPSLRQLLNQAKDLRQSHQDSDPDAIHRIGQSHPRFSGSSEAAIAIAGFALADAQLVIARELGFDSWPKLKTHVESLSSSAVSMHELVTGDDLEAMEDAVARDPQSVNEPNEVGLPPLYTAALYRNQLTIDFLLGHGATVDIFACAYLGKPEDAEGLLKRSPELARATTPDGLTALHFAARAGHYDVCDLLLRHGSDANARDHRRRTALIEACHGGPWKREPAEEIIALLLDNNVDIDLFAAAAAGRTDLIETLLDQDDTLIDDLNEDGQTALFVAAQNNRFAAVKLLVEGGADVNRTDAVGIAALHRTSQQCSDELIQYLIDQGVDAHLCCYVACGDEAGTREALARNPDAANDIFYEFNAVGFAIHCWQLGTLRIMLEHGRRLSQEDQQHILRISNGNQQLLDSLMQLQGE